MNCENSDLSEFIFIPSFIRLAGEDEPAPNVWVFIDHLVEHCSANAEAISSHPVQNPRTFFGLKLRK